MTRNLVLKTAVALLLLTGMAGTAAAQSSFVVPNKDPKVNLRFDRYYDYEGYTQAFRQLERAYPKFLKMISIGKSYEGRELWVMIINNPDTGPELTKAAMWVDGNIHGNEIQGAEINLYITWFLMENYNSLPDVKKVVDERVFYIMPTQNPDGRQYWFEHANTSSSSRSPAFPVDDDNDGRFDEDPSDDLDGDGNITSMRKYVPGEGNMKISPIDPRLMIPVGFGEKGDYINLGSEGIDNDGDGRINEDGPGGMDPNRNWPADWQPDYLQGGAHWYPFSLPESRAVSEFMQVHPNIAGSQAWHNSAGMILRGPGAESHGEYSRRDVQAYDAVGRRGELILPYYRYVVIWSGLYTVHGGFIDYTHDEIGAWSFSNELWSSSQYFNEAITDANSDLISRQTQMLFYNDKLGMGAWFVDWHEVDHPQYGKIEVGGFGKYFNRVTPPFMLQELVHRNAMFAIFHASQMPKVEMGDVKVERVAGNTWKVTATAVNPMLLGTINDNVRRNRRVMPDVFSITGSGLTVNAAAYPSGRFGDEVQLIDTRTPGRLSIDAGLAGEGTQTVVWFVTGRGRVTVTYTSQKGGTVTKEVELR
jgi:hypothetical protein